MVNGNGSRAPHNRVTLSDLYKRCCAEIETRYPRVADERVFSRIEAFMVIIEPEDDARHLGGSTFLVQTPG